MRVCARTSPCVRALARVRARITHLLLPEALLRRQHGRLHCARARLGLARMAEQGHEQGEAEGAGAAVRGVLRGLVGAAARRARQLLVPVGTGLS